MEDLSKHQLILLVLLITFITSIGTGIITFTLLQEAPVEVTQTINRVVEKTIERVVTEPGKPEKVVTTVVVNEEDKVLEAIAKNEKSIVRIKTLGADGSEILAGLGLVVSSNGVIAYNLANYSKTSSYNITFHDGKTYPTGGVYLDQANGIIFMETAVPRNDTSKYIFYPITFGNSDTLKIGQTLVALSGRESNAVSIGRVRQLIFGKDKNTVESIVSDIPILKNYPGSPVLNLSGEVVGIEEILSGSGDSYSYTPINTLRSSMENALKELAR